MCYSRRWCYLYFEFMPIKLLQTRRNFSFIGRNRLIWQPWLTTEQSVQTTSLQRHPVLTIFADGQFLNCSTYTFSRRSCRTKRNDRNAEFGPWAQKQSYRTTLRCLHNMLPQFCMSSWLKVSPKCRSCQYETVVLTKFYNEDGCEAKVDFFIPCDRLIDHDRCIVYPGSMLYSVPNHTFKNQ